MKFKCILSGCVYDFTSDFDIKSMRQSHDYVVVDEMPTAPASEAPAEPSTVVLVPPVALGPDKPLPAAAKAPKAV